MKRLFTFALFVFFGLLLTSCNIWGTFQSTSSDQDFIEEAENCLAKGDYACAIEKYSKISNGNLRKQRLCTAYLAKGGFTLVAFLTIVNKSQATMLGELAQRLAPWNSEKGSDTANAYTQCHGLLQEPEAGQTGRMMDTVGTYVDCAMRMAKTDVIACSAGGDGAETAGDGSGTITTSDIGNMCATDVGACRVEMALLSAAQLSQDGLSGLSGSLDAVPADIKDDTSTNAETRTALQGTIPP